MGRYTRQYIILIIYIYKDEKCLFFEPPLFLDVISIIQNLKDAGCTDELIEEFRTLEEHAEEERQLQLLSGHRKHLLEELHKEEKRIDCLDYLIYQIEHRKQKGGFFG